MRLQLAEDEGQGKSAANAADKVAKYLNSPEGQNTLKLVGAMLANMPRAEVTRYNATLAAIRNSLGLNQGMTLGLATQTLENIPWLISDANTKMAAAKSAGDKRVIARYIRAFEQIANETMAWVKTAYVPPPGQRPAPDPININNPPTGANPAFPGSPGAGQFFKNPVFLIGAGAILYLILKRK